jgi:glutathione synthase
VVTFIGHSAAGVALDRLVDFLFLMDPLESVNAETDTTYALMRKACARGHSVWCAELVGLELQQGIPWVRTRPVEVPGPRGTLAWRGIEEWREVAGFPMVWLRKDPPFDLRYVEATWILDCVDAARCQVINDPTGVRAANEKLYALRFPELCPPTLVCADRGRLRAFIERHGEVVLKPLNSAGGEGILFASRGMRGLNALLETATRNGSRCEAQAYLPAAEKGDKRILLLDGEPLGAVLRLHGPGEERNNLHLGGRAETASIGPEDRRIIERVAPALRQDGLVLVGLDVIGDRLTEVNVTSPTCIQELERFDRTDPSGAVIEWCERHAPGKTLAR